jgi:hypothetical protein
MGYSTDRRSWPLKPRVKSHIQSHETVLFYELAHGTSFVFSSTCAADGNCYDGTSASEIESWIAGYTKMPFTFVGSCDSMCFTGDNTFAHEFRKGSDENATVVGYCGMSEEQCDTCWNYSCDWQNALFYYMKHEWTVRVQSRYLRLDFSAW